MLTSSKHRLITLLATLMFAGYLHSATLDESQMSRTLQPALCALSSSMMDIREVLARCGREGKEERLCESNLVMEVRAAGDGDTEEENKLIR
ncbi:Uncharacterised protein [Serratia fonticola]|uniref:Uncharacterized protein n=1 Tax=Serratia fonticola TaxID=47917 RepID=A0A0F7HCF9_SERFO|nr:hypothetical protein [Serratia fonticola]AKG70137.1 hypothetical protein WN53_14090 [Serratia fonticola]CAI1938871.1 Uncharacterised protein [Serratia fonticola]VTR34734.1 Uncharacterised protein [Serratia fonticola]